MTPAIQIRIPGRPVGKARPRVVRRGRVTVAYTPRATAEYEHTVGHYAALACRAPLEGPIGITITVTLTPPKSWTKTQRAKAATGERWAQCKPDIDNIAKAILDALDGICYRDDSQVVHLELMRRWGDQDSVLVEVRGLG